MKRASAIAWVCGVWLSGSVAFAGSAADWIDAEVAANQNVEAVQMVEDETFRIPALPKRLVAKARKHVKKNKVVWFVRGARVKRQAQVFRAGDIERVVVQPVQKGAVITVATRGKAAKIVSRLSLEGGPQSRVVLKGIAAAPMRQSSQPAKAAAKRQVVLQDEVAGKVAEEEKTESTLTVDEPIKVREASAMGFMAIALLGAIGGLFGMTKWLQKRGKKTGNAEIQAGIDVVAVKALGPKHRLALIEACGEKLLVSASDKEVKLLSHVGNHLVAEEPNDAEELAEESMSDVFANLVQASSERRDEKEFNTEIVEEFTPAEFPEFVREPKSLSADLEGLVRLRERRGPKLEKSSGGVFEHLTRRYKSNGAAA